MCCKFWFIKSFLLNSFNTVNIFLLEESAIRKLEDIGCLFPLKAEISADKFEECEFQISDDKLMNIVS